MDYRCGRVLFNDGFTLAAGRRISAGENQSPGEFAPVFLPHDYNSGMPLDEHGRGGGSQGFVDCFHDVTYRKAARFGKVPGRRHLLEFEGVYRNAQLYVNGKLAAEHAYGYTSFTADITDFIRDGENLIEIYVDNRDIPELGCPADRWYSGMGIYRDVYYHNVGELHIPQWGTVFRQVTLEGERAQFELEIKLQNCAPEPKRAEIVTELVAPDGAVAAVLRSPHDAAPGGSSLTQACTLEHIKHWDIDSPNVYTAVTRVECGGETVDTYSTELGFRTIGLDRNRGMLLNGRVIKLNGVDLHHDSGSIGSAFIPSVWEHRLRRLKAFGCNCIRTSHNPQSPRFYELCNRLGLLVFDEFFDKWHWKDSYINAIFDTVWRGEVAATIARDRNNPCVFCWSVGNEVDGQGKPEMASQLAELYSYTKSIDSTRPVTVVLMPMYESLPDSTTASPDQKVEALRPLEPYMDILTFNYSEPVYAAYRRAFPNKLILGTEIFQYYTPGTHHFECLSERHPWAYVAENDYVIGGIYWAGYDYLGESSGWPARGWSGSLCNIAGFPRPHMHLAAAYWLQKPYIHAAVADQSSRFEYANAWWSYPKFVEYYAPRERAELTAVSVFTNCEAAEMLTDGYSRGKQYRSEALDSFCNEFKFYVPGWANSITVIGYDHGVETCRDTLGKSGAAVDFDVTCSADALQSGGSDAAVAEITLRDAGGNIAYTDRREVSFECSGGAVLMGVDSGDIAEHVDYRASRVGTWSGRCSAVVRLEGGGGDGKLRVRVKGIRKAKTVVLVTRP